MANGEFNQLDIIIFSVLVKTIKYKFTSERINFQVLMT